MVAGNHLPKLLQGPSEPFHLPWDRVWLGHFSAGHCNKAYTHTCHMVVGWHHMGGTVAIK